MRVRERVESTPGVLKYSRSTLEYFGVFGVIRSFSGVLRNTPELLQSTLEYCGVQKSTSEYSGVLVSDSLSYLSKSGCCSYYDMCDMWMRGLGFSNPMRCTTTVMVSGLQRN